MTDDLTGAEEQKKGIEDRNKRLENREISDLKKIWSMPEGRRYMLTLARKSGCLTHNVPADRDAFLRERKIGRWEFGNGILQAAEYVAPELLLLAKREAANDKLLREQEIKNEVDVSDN